MSQHNHFDVHSPSGTEDPLSAAEIQQYREEINRLDREVIEAIQRRTAISQAIGQARKQSGGTKLVHGREVAIINDFIDALGHEGGTIANSLLKMGRGALG